MTRDINHKGHKGKILNPKSQILNKSKILNPNFPNGFEFETFEFRICLGFSILNLGFPLLWAL